ncbi:MAG: hypothetical protein WA071_14785 [Undibacterium umbellatum]|uniref:hypothetical protein n=1 Tax=Undibacterium umbellatum TaxID=2762300 RepID=UPI003BB64F2E
MNMLTSVLPLWSRVMVTACLVGVVFLLGQLHGERVAGDFHNEYVGKQAAQTVKIIKAQAKVVTETETIYKDRFIKIYEKGDKNEKETSTYVTADDSAACVVNSGFVRHHDSAWSSNTAGPATIADREPSGISLTAVAETNAFNATTCLAWREQALGLRDFYKKLQTVTNESQE